MNTNELTHHGIKGMRWGIRRYQNKDGTLTPAGKKRYDQELAKLKSEEKILKNRQRTAAKFEKLENMRKNNDAMREVEKQHEPAKPVKIKRIKDMSDAELKAFKERLQLEKDVKDLANSTRNETIKKGQTFVENVLTKSGENLTTQVLNHYGSKAINKLIKEEVIFANNKKK